MKKTLKVIALTCIGGLLSIQQVGAKDKAQELPFWIIKTSYNYYYVNTPSGQLDGLRATNTRTWAGVFPESSVEGNLRGFTVDIGRIFKSRNNLRLISIDMTSRNGDLDGYIIYHKNTEFEVINTVKGDREDIDIKVLYQWLGETWQPYIGLGYLRYQKKITDQFPEESELPWSWSGNGTKIGHIDKVLDGITFGGGIGVNIFEFGPFEFKGKFGFFAIYGNSKISDDREIGEQTASGKGWGLMLKPTFMINMPLTFNKYAGGVFLDLGYHYQQFHFPGSIGTQDVWYGPYFRVGIGMIF